jgi:hypothetical protein
MASGDGETKRMSERSMVAVCLLAASCAVSASAVRERFALDHSCPEERVSAHERSDVKPSDILLAHDEQPPPEVAADPQRLAMWRDRNRAQAERWDDDHGVYEVQGCGAAGVYACGRNNHDYFGPASCVAIGPQPGPSTPNPRR